MPERIRHPDPSLLAACIICHGITTSAKRMTVLDCLNCVQPYLFNRHDAREIADSMFLCRIAHLSDLCRILSTIHQNSYFRQSDTLMIIGEAELDDPTGRRREMVHRAMTRIEARHCTDVISVDAVEG